MRRTSRGNAQGFVRGGSSCPSGLRAGGCIRCTPGSAELSSLWEAGHPDPGRAIAPALRSRIPVTNEGGSGQSPQLVFEHFSTVEALCGQGAGVGRSLSAWPWPGRGSSAFCFLLATYLAFVLCSWLTGPCIGVGVRMYRRESDLWTNLPVHLSCSSQIDSI